MRFIFKTILFLFLTFFNAKSQELVEFSLGPGYQYDIYYSFNDGITAYPERTNWDLAFSTNSMDCNIRINCGKGVTLFQVSDDMSQWENINSIPSGSTQLRNSSKYWEVGAFVSNSSGQNDYGWGEYDPVSESVLGKGIYVINFDSNTKKIKVNNCDGGQFNLTISNLDGSNEYNQTIDTNPYSDKKFIFYSITNDLLIDREPTSWDIVFTKYEEDLENNPSNPFYYLVSGGLTNNNGVAEYNGFLDFNPTQEELNFTYEINTIGYDWKTYTGGFSIVPDRAYFVMSQDNQSLHKIVFQSFDGQQSGNMSFTVENLDFNNKLLDKDGLTDISIYPNPSKGTLKIDFSEEDSFIQISDLNGRTIYEESGPFHSHEIYLQNKGQYIASITTNNNIFVKSIFVCE
tara:strand:- start:3837 stop:5042 length:1206 start_codon:yes stop_codon:yes gene_type:complete